MSSNTTQTSGTQRIKDLQAYLNKHGYTDDSGSALAVDGSIGPKTQQALQKFNTHQTHMNAPDPETRDIQIFLNDAGYKNADGTPLTIDGIHGPNTDNAINQFENDFLSQIVPNYTPKTVHTKVFPQVPNLSKVDTVSPDDYNTTGFTGNSGQQQASDQPVAYSPPNTTKSAQSQPVPQPQQPPRPEPNRQPPSAAAQTSYTSGSTGSSANASSSNNIAVDASAKGNSGTQLANPYKQYAQAKDYTDKLQKRADDYQKQADAIATDLPDMAQKVRAGLANQKDYNALVSQIQALRDQAESSRRLAQSYQNGSDTYRKGMDNLLADQVPVPQKESALFDSPEECARDFAERAMPLTDKNNKEYSAVMTTVQVPVFENGQWITKPKYKYGEIAEGNHGDVINNALTGLLGNTDGEKYLLHTHPNSIYTNYKNSGQIYVDHPDDFSQPGDADVPTTLGKNGVVQVLKSLGLPVSGYNGIYLASPTGKLFYYDGTGNITKKTDTDVTPKGTIFPQAKVQWDTTTNTYTPGYWALDANGYYMFVPTP